MTLLEYMVSASGMVLLMALFLGGVTQLYAWRRSLLSTFYTVSSEWIAGVKIARDIRYGPQTQQKWELAVNRISWHEEEQHIWYCAGRKLLFREGRGVVSVDAYIAEVSGSTDCASGLVRGIHLRLQGSGSTGDFIMYIPLYAKLFACL